MLNPVFLHAQQSGIKFERDLTWQQIKMKAFKEGKYIFVECFATWCGPCKYMDQNVYSDEKVAKEANYRFICVKVQMDSSIYDDSVTRNWYIDAHDIRTEFRISVLPTYLFFSRDGVIVHKAVGIKSSNEFMSMLNDAIDTSKQYYTLLAKYSRGTKEYRDLPYLATAAYEFGDQDKAAQIANDYMDNFLFRLPEQDLFTKDNIEFVRHFTKASDQEGFAKFYSRGHIIDSIFGERNYAQRFIDDVILKEEIDTRLWRDSNRHLNPFSNSPDWNGIAAVIKRKYKKEYAERVLLNGQLEWFFVKENWPEYCKTIVKKFNRYGPYGSYETDFNLNAIAWELFEYSSDNYQLEKAIRMSDTAIKLTSGSNASYLDTYANLLYKMKRKKDALFWEARAAALDPKDTGIMYNLKKMRNGEKTWLIPSDIKVGQ